MIDVAFVRSNRMRCIPGRVVTYRRMALAACTARRHLRCEIAYFVDLIGVPRSSGDEGTGDEHAREGAGESPGLDLRFSAIYVKRSRQNHDFCRQLAKS